MENSNLNSITEQNFLNFCKNSKLKTIFGFHSNGVTALTNDENLFNLLHIIQFQKMQNTKIETFSSKSAKALKHLTKDNNNSIYFKQADLDANLLILTDDEQKLKDYTPFVVKYFKDASRLEFFITVDGQSNIKFNFDNADENFSAEPGYDNILINSMGSLNNAGIVNRSIDNLMHQAKFNQFN